MVQPIFAVKATIISWCQEKQGYKMPHSRRLLSFPSRLVSLLANLSVRQQPLRVLSSLSGVLPDSQTMASKAQLALVGLLLLATVALQVCIFSKLL
jgi:hypothetical protein